MDFNQMLLNPMTQVGLGILGAGGPGVGGWQQIGRGATAGMGNIMANQALKEESEQRKLQAEIARSEMERAKAEAMRQFEMDQQARALQQQRDQAAQAYIQDNPEMAPLYKMGGADAVLGIVEQQMKPQDPQKPPTGMRVAPDGSWVADPNWLKAQMALKAAGKTTIQNKNIYQPPNPLNKSVVTGLQEKSIAAQTMLPEIDQLISDIQMLPSGVGGIADTREAAGGWLGQLSAMGIPGAGTLSDLATPDITITDPNAPGGQRTITPQVIKTGSEKLAIGLKPLMADSGPLSNQDRVRLESAVGMSASADAKRRLEALTTIREIFTRNQPVIDKFLREGGAGVPGAPVGPPVGTIEDGFEYIGGDPGSQSSWRPVQ